MADEGESKGVVLTETGAVDGFCSSSVAVAIVGVASDDAAAGGDAADMVAELWLELFVHGEANNVVVVSCAGVGADTGSGSAISVLDKRPRLCRRMDSAAAAVATARIVTESVPVAVLVSEVVVVVVAVAVKSAGKIATAT